MINLSDSAARILDGINIEPVLVLEIEGYDSLFGVASILRLIRIGDPGLEIGDDWVIGGSVAVEGQKSYISMGGGGSTTTTISQQLQPDKGAVSSISAVTVSLVDKNSEVTRLISPGLEVTEILGVKCNLYVGFASGSYPQDYSLLFSGFLADIESGAGFVNLTINHPDEKKRQNIFPKIELVVNEPIDISETSIDFVSSAGLLLPSPELRTFVKIENEYIEYTGIASNTITGCVRGSLTAQGGGVAATHNNGLDAVSFYILEDLAIELALKIMLSGGGYYGAADAKNFNQVQTLDDIPNSIFFVGVDVQDKYGIVPGDFVTVTGATDVANNFADKEILTVVAVEDGSYITIDGVTTVAELDTGAVVSFQSQYDVLPSGLSMTPQEVDVPRHEYLRDTFLGSTNMRFYLKDSEEGKEFIEKEIYLPMACYSLPRKTRSSVGIHIAPIPTDTPQIINAGNIKSPSKIKLRRSLGKNFYNVIVYKFDEGLNDDKFKAGVIYTNAQSISEIGKRQVFTVEARGFRSDLQAVTVSSTAANRRLDRYKRGAEYIDGLEILFRDGLVIEPGDIVVFDPTDLFVSDTVSGTRTKPQKFFEVINKSVNLRNGAVTLSITDTSFDATRRYGLISPASKVANGLSTTQFVIKPSYSQKYGPDEFRKWDRYIGAYVKVHSEDHSVVGHSYIVAVAGNAITLSPALAFTPPANYIMELGDYDNQPDLVKLIYTFMSNGASNFADGGSPYLMI